MMKKIKDVFPLIFVLTILSMFIYKCMRGNRDDKKFATESEQLRAIIIKEKNYFPNSPVSHEFSYSYQFILRGKYYKGNSLDSKFKIGDSILIKYVKSDPNINAPVMP
jgi:hypothetical protein